MSKSLGTCLKKEILFLECEWTASSEACLNHAILTSNESSSDYLVSVLIDSESWH